MNYYFNEKKFFEIIIYISLSSYFKLRKISKICHSSKMSNADVISTKLVLLGESGVGKTAIAQRYVLDSFSPDQQATVAASYLSKRIESNSISIDLNIWDTAGQEVYRTLAPMYYRDAKMALIVFDLTDENSFNQLNEWITDVREKTPDIIITIIGNKSDLDEERVVSFEKASDLANQFNLMYIETSAFSGLGVEECFNTTVDRFIEEMNKEKEVNASVSTNLSNTLNTTVHLEAPQELKSIDKKCC